MTQWIDALPPGGEMVTRLAETDWAATSLGPVDGWPEPIRGAVALAMASRFPMLVCGGPDLVQVYNDAFIPLFAEKHPQIGVPVRETWPEIWDVIGPMMRDVLDTHQATWAEDQMFWINRVGFLEDIYFTFSYSPILDRDGVAQGLLATAVETTERVVEARRHALVADVAAQAATGVEATARLAAAAIGRHPADVPCALVYLRDDDGGHRLAGATGVSGDHAAPARLAPGATAPWTLPPAGATDVTIVAGGAEGLGATHGLSERPVTDVALIPLGTHGTLVAGLSPTRRIDDALRAFLGLLGTQLSGALAVARAVQEEQARVDELQELDRVKSTFFANVSHELRTPVTLMLAPLADALGDVHQPLPPIQRARIGTAHRNAGRLIGLVDDVLDFTRDGETARRPRRVRVDVGARTADLAGAFLPAAEQAGIDLHIDCPEPVKPTWIDPHLWERIVLNLVGNALKFTPSGTISVRLRDEGDALALEVQDTGTGIPPEEHERIFERFHQVPNPSARTSEGAGIGLSLVRRLVALQGGEITVQSTPGEGSTFTVRLPTGAPDGEDANGPDPSPMVDRAALAAVEALGWVNGGTDEARAEASDGNGDRPRVLFADDNADMRAYVSSVLQPRFEVETVADGAAALQAARTAPPDLVLTDVMMPVLGGFDLLDALRSDPITAALPVVLLSARAGDEAVVEGLDRGADEYLLKPFSSTELVARVARTIELTRTRSQLAEAAARHEADLRLLRAEARYRHAGRAARVGTWALNVVTGEAQCDANLEDLFGVPEGTLTSLAACMDYIEPADHEKVVAEIAAAAASPDETIHEFRVLRGDGERRVFQWRASTDLDDDGRRVLFGATWDATALADAQAALRESEQAAPAGIAIVELDGTISRANRALAELLGRGSEELTGTPFASLVHPDEDPLTVIAADHAVTRELRLLGTGGEAVWATVSAAPVRGADGVPRHHVVHVQDARERKRFEGELQHLAEHDALTDLWNRRRFNEEVDRALADAQRTGTSGALLLFDLDGLKHINDTLGHAVGDQLLGAVADVLRGRLRATDIPARLGGDEFAVLLPRADEQAARTLAAGLLESIGAVSPLTSSAGAGTISACAGIAVFGGSDDVVSGEQLLIEADVALYAAKDAGRGKLRLRHIGAEAGPATERRPRWSARIREALDDDRFVLHAQPIVALAEDGGAERAEILLRLRDDRGQLQSPATFLPTAERSALIQEIDRWVVHAALADLGARVRAGKDLCRHVNLSARSVIDPGMGRYVCDELDASGVDGRRLVIEVTETSAIVNLERARDFVDTIRARGCQLALDDFGAGFTSFHYLKHLDFTYVKIDGAFIEGLDADPTNQSLVRALADMARSLGKKTVAECVQDEATVRWLRDLGVDYAQGFHLGCPEPL